METDLITTWDIHINIDKKEGALNASHMFSTGKLKKKKKKKKHILSNFPPFLRIVGSILGLFVLILLHFSCWI